MRILLQCLFIFVFLFNIVDCHAEIKQIGINWKPSSCSNRCKQSLERSLYALPQVWRVDNNFQGGQTVLYWKPRRTLQMKKIIDITKSLGIEVNSVTATVSGTIQHLGSRVYISSLGDNTRIELVSESPDSLKTTSSRYQRHTKLDEDLRQRLIASEDQTLLVTLSGQLIELDRQPVVKLLVEQVNISGEN